MANHVQITVEPGTTLHVRVPTRDQEETQKDHRIRALEARIETQNRSIQNLRDDLAAQTRELLSREGWVTTERFNREETARIEAERQVEVLSRHLQAYADRANWHNPDDGSQDPTSRLWVRTPIAGGHLAEGDPESERVEDGWTLAEDALRRTGFLVEGQRNGNAFTPRRKTPPCGT